MGPPAHLTPEQIAKAAERKAAKDAKRAAASANGTVGQNGQPEVGFLKRQWLPIPVPANGDGGESVAGKDAQSSRKGIRIVTWNILAQTLIRRELFPGSDCLKWPERKRMLETEMAHHGHNADVVCLQECDRLKDIMHSLPFDSCVQARGHGKQHGLVIMYRSDRLEFKASKTIHLDEEYLAERVENQSSVEDQEREARRRRGGSRQTKNVGLIVGLGVNGDDKGGETGKGMIVVTTHLFWHPKYQYERVRQLIVLLRAIREFQAKHGLQSWPVFFAGDFNTSPSEPAYQLLVDPQQELTPSAIQAIDDSRLVHDSVDRIGRLHVRQDITPSNAASQSGTGANTPAIDASDNSKPNANPNITPPATQSTLPTIPLPAGPSGGDDEGGLPDNHEKSLANTRPPSDDDGMMTVDELQSALRGLLGDGVRSAYGSVAWTRPTDETFKSRKGFEKEDGIDWGRDMSTGGNEPGWTCFTGLFQLTLDYLFILPPYTNDAGRPVVTALLRPPRRDELGEGLPKKGISASDHVAVGAEFSW